MVWGRTDTPAMPTPRPRASRGWHLSVRRSSTAIRLAVLAVIPLLGIGALGGTLADERFDRAASAERIAKQVTLVGRLDTVRQAVTTEGLMSESLLATSYLGVPSSALVKPLGLDLAVAVKASRATTDAQLRRLGAPAVAGSVDKALTTVRHTVVTHETKITEPQLNSIYQAFASIAQTLTAAEDQAIDSVSGRDVADGTTPTVLSSLNQAFVVARLAEDVEAAFPLTVGAHDSLTADQDASRALLVAPWGAFQQEASIAATSLTGQLAQKWAAIQHNAAVRAFESSATQVLASSAPAAIPLSALALVAADGLTATTMIGDLLNHAVAAAQADAVRDHAAVASRAEIMLGVIIAVCLAVLVVGLAVGRSIRRPLFRLAEGAERISQGQLVDIDGRGPREVRVVAAALNAAVGNLRRVEAQATALARGELDAPPLAEAVPGSLGEAVHNSIRQIATSFRERARLQDELAFQAAHDPLTNLANRGASDTLLRAALARAGRSGHDVGLLFVDLDRFKAVNDTFGHAAGDHVLQVTAERMRCVVRSGDTVCRLGGDEFVVIVEPAGSNQDLLELAQRLIAAISVPVRLNDGMAEVGASIGVAISPRGAVDAEHLLHDADAAVYWAKFAGRGTVEFFNQQLRQELRRANNVERQIAAALRNDEFLVVYQPIVGTESAAMHSLEALVRWRRADGTLEPPGSFIPIAERSDLIVDIDRRVLEIAAAELVRLSENPRFAAVAVSVNISPRHLAHPGLVQHVRDALERHRLDPSRLIVEITETIPLQHPAAIDNLAALQSMGVRIALDDFGTGYTSIGQLERLAADVLKVDRTLTAGHETTHSEIVRLIVQVAHGLGMTVVAEGVEDAAQVPGLSAQGCDFLQGYLIARPMLPDALLEWADRALSGDGVLGAVAAPGSSPNARSLLV